MEGKVKFFNEEKGFGFIEPQEGKDVFVHISKIEGNQNLQDNQRVSFEVQDGERGPMAVDVKILADEDEDSSSDEE
jgi:CspA family cold shock protein